MDLISSVLSAILFVAFVPGVLFRFPEKSSHSTVVIAHAVLFAVTVSLVMQYYWQNIRGFIEGMGNYGTTCPNGYVLTPDEDCVPAGHATRAPTA